MGRKLLPANFYDLPEFLESKVQPSIEEHGAEGIVLFRKLVKREPVSGRTEFAPGLWADVVGRCEEGYLLVTCNAQAFKDAAEDGRIVNRLPKKAKS